MASALAGAGAAVAVCGRSPDRGAERCQKISEIGGKAQFFSIDASSPESVYEVEKGVSEAFGPATILVNAAGGNQPYVTVTEGRRFEEIKPEDWNAGFELNVVGGALVPCQVFGPGFCERKHGSIINIASVSAHVPLSRVVAYSAAKAATVSLTQFLAREWAPFHVRVNSITPGFFPAAQNRALLFNEDGSPTPRAEAILGHTPMSRFGNPEELAGAVIFLASSSASGFVTGADIRVDGGFLAQTV